MSVTIIASTTVIRLFILCNYGSEIELNSSRFLDDVYDQNWTKDKLYKKNFTIVQKNLQIAVKIKVYGFLFINLEVFQTIVNTAYTMIAVFKKIE